MNYFKSLLRNFKERSRLGIESGLYRLRDYKHTTEGSMGYLTIGSIIFGRGCLIADQYIKTVCM